MTALICSRCGQEISPGDKVEIIGADEEQRIIVEDDALIVHQTCPTKEEA